jgi:hypothetical protein
LFKWGEFDFGYSQKKFFAQLEQLVKTCFKRCLQKTDKFGVSLIYGKRDKNAQNGKVADVGLSPVNDSSLINSNNIELLLRQFSHHHH